MTDLAALTPCVQACHDQGWQETTDAALTFLLRTSLAKAGKENQERIPCRAMYSRFLISKNSKIPAFKCVRSTKCLKKYWKFKFARFQCPKKFKIAREKVGSTRGVGHGLRA